MGSIGAGSAVVAAESAKLPSDTPLHASGSDESPRTGDERDAGSGDGSFCIGESALSSGFRTVSMSALGVVPGVELALPFRSGVERLADSRPLEPDSGCSSSTLLVAEALEGEVEARRSSLARALLSLFLRSPMMGFAQRIDCPTVSPLASWLPVLGDASGM
jgi:hypothetical protein